MHAPMLAASQFEVHDLAVIGYAVAIWLLTAERIFTNSESVANSRAASLCPTPAAIKLWAAPRGQPAITAVAWMWSAVLVVPVAVGVPVFV